MSRELRELAARRHVEERSDSRPFAFHWLDSAYQETVLHNAPWDAVKKLICDSLANKIQKQRDEPERMQMIFQLVGPEFKNIYFPDLAYEPFLLQPPHLNNEQVSKLRGEAQSWLCNQTQKSAKEVGCGRVPPGTAPGDDLADQQLEFLQHTYEIFLKNLDRYMYQKDLEEKERLHDDGVEQEQLLRHQEEKAKVPVKYRSASSLSSVPSSAVSRKDTTLSQTISKMVGPEPHYHGFQTETAGLSVKKILQRDPKRFTDVAQRLHGRQIGRTLRTYCWLDVLFKADRDSLREGNVEKLVRARFINQVRRGAIDLSVKNPTTSPISGLIDNAVVETYSKTLAMQRYNVPAHLKDAARALNVLYVYDRTYEPYLVYWVFPLQLALREHAGTPEYVYELAMYLDLLNKNCYPSWPKIFAMADKSLLRLEHVDKELYDHLKLICLEDVQFDPKEFMVYLIHEEREKAQALLNIPPQSAESFMMSKELLADALIFLRKWIGEGFVSVLDTPAVLFLWDQNFLQLWQGQAIENMCLTLLELLRYKFMEASNYSEMKHVFLHEPGKLYTADIQRAWVHVERGGKPFEVQFFNRQRPVLKLRPSTADLHQMHTPLSFSHQGRLAHFGVKNIQVKLVIPSDQFYKHAWLAQFDPDNMRMMFLLYFGEHKIAHRLSTVTPLVRMSTQADGSMRLIVLDYLGDVLVYDQEELSHKYRVLVDAAPFLVVRVDYLHTTEKIVAPHPLAWAKVITHAHRDPATAEPRGKYLSMSGDNCDWLVLARSVQLELVYGVMPQCLLALPPRPAPRAISAILAAGSQVTLTVYDPDDDSPKGTPETMGSQHKSPTPQLSAEPTRRPETAVRYWLPHNPDVSAEDTAQVVELNEPFDLYIDALRFLPDNATIVKITGRFLKTGEVTNIPDIASYPEKDSNPKNPFFNFRMVVNESRHDLDSEALLILRVYTVEKHSRDLVVVGSCLLDCVNVTGKINTGGFQLRLRNGMPDISEGIQKLRSSSMDSITPVPSASILVRVLPHQPGYRAMPDYQSAYYQSHTALPNTSENNIFDRYNHDDRLEKDWTEVIAKIKSAEQDESATEVLGVRPYMEARLDAKRYLAPQTPARNLDLRQSVRYRVETGLGVRLQACGLPDGLWSQCLVWVQPADRARAKRHRRNDGYGNMERKLTENIDYSGAQKAPRWTDDSELHPYFDEKSFLVIELYGLKFQYKSAANPAVLGVSGQPLSEQDLTAAWAVVPLFLNDSLMTGDHLVPMFRGLPDYDMLERMSARSLREGLKETRPEKFQSACFKVRLLDLHFLVSEFPVQPLPVYEELVECLGDSGYSRTSRDESGKVLSDLILRYLPPDIAKAGAHGDKFEREKQAFHEAAHTAAMALVKSMNRM